MFFDPSSEHNGVHRTKAHVASRIEQHLCASVCKSNRLYKTHGHAGQRHQPYHQVYLHPHPSSSMNEIRLVLPIERMCEQIIKYDCGHMCRRMIPSIQREPKHHHSLTCFSALSLHSYGPERHETPKFERRATLCPKCEAKGEDGEVYVNGTRRASAPQVGTRQESKLVRQGEKTTATKVSAGIGRSVSNPVRPPLPRLRRVRDTGNSSLRNEYHRLEPLLDPRPAPRPEPRTASRPESHPGPHPASRLETLRNPGFEARRGRKHRPEDIVTQDVDLDWFAASMVPLCERSPTSPTSFTGLLEYNQRNHNMSTLSLGRLSRSTSVLKMLQKGLQRQPSMESFVCASAKEVERGEE
ncbi:hypothetical protein BBK36DRAFT_1188694 [Trichoderma citrinoviride]|uniref:Uncharacterized protein n=1 Tax=Trichoderma citrinoviride TaxID=58853 RepID=A0A2T4BKP6_9HYPO|nr:hypothetical protein BBK36DRAFT_1188694 [Trichoderma citrinoviride]PTB69849.1 hypothetical protein BBK36DRAFT_1188694 [Trichoderma citrinoviride]